MVSTKIKFAVIFFLLFLSFQGFSDDSKEKKAQKIIKNYIKKIGGEKQILSLRTFKTSGNITQGSTEMNYENIILFPDKLKGKITMTGYSEISTFNAGTEEYSINDSLFINTNVDAVRWNQIHSWIIPLAYLDHIALKVVYVGGSIVEDANVEEIYIEFKNGQKWNVLFDAKTYLIHTVKSSFGMDSRYLRYKLVNNILFPVEYELKIKGVNVAKLFLRDVQYNIKINPGEFKLVGNTTDLTLKESTEYIDFNEIKIQGELELISKASSLRKLLGEPDSVINSSLIDPCVFYYNKNFRYAYYQKSVVELYDDTAVLTSINFQNKASIELITPMIALNSNTTLLEVEKLFPIAVENKSEREVKGIGRTICIQLDTSKVRRDDRWLLFFINGKLIRIDYWMPC
jgi:hypothetical protein